MLDSDLTESHGIGTKRLSQAVSRKPEERDGDTRVSQSCQAAIPTASEAVSWGKWLQWPNKNPDPFFADQGMSFGRGGWI